MWAFLFLFPFLLLHIARKLISQTTSESSFPIESAPDTESLGFASLDYSASTSKLWENPSFDGEADAWRR